MKSFRQHIMEKEESNDIHSMDYDKNHGKSFRWAYTPKNQAGTFSLVTPSNAGAWKKWKPVSSTEESMLKDKWHQHKEAGTLHNFVAPHKAKQIQTHRIP
jgi:hypothetical protein